MLTKTIPAAKHVAARKQKENSNKPVTELKLVPLNSQLTDWCDKEFIQTSLKVKDGALKNWRKKNELPGAHLMVIFFTTSLLL